MKNSAIKIVRFLFNKKNVNKLKNNLNKKTVLLAILAILILSIFIYFLRPMFFKYDSYKQVFEKKVYDLVKIETKSPAFSIAGPEVTFISVPLSFAITLANVVFPSPGGPYSKT